MQTDFNYTHSGNQRADCNQGVASIKFVTQVAVGQQMLFPYLMNFTRHARRIILSVFIYCHIHCKLKMKEYVNQPQLCVQSRSKSSPYDEEKVRVFG